MIDTAAATKIVSDARLEGHKVTIMVTGATTPQVGKPISVNSKGVNIRTEADGKVRSFSLKRIESITVNTPQANVRDGMSTAEVAEIFDMSAKELRVHLRKLGLGVGKGRRYGLAAADVHKLREHLTTADA